MIGAEPSGRGLAVALMLWAALGSGCSIRKMALRESAEVMQTGMAAVTRETDVELARLSFPANLKTLEILLESDPDSPIMLGLLAQGFASYAYLMLEDEIDVADAAFEMERVRKLKARASGIYGRAAGYALRRMNRPGLARAMEEGSLDDVRREAEALGKEDVAALFWFAFSRASRINLDQSNPALISELPKVDLLLQRVLDLEPGYFQGLPLLTAGVSFAGRAAMFGGDLPRGRKYLEQGIEVSGGRFLLGKFLLARFYAVQAQDAELFCRLLDEVASADPDFMPEQGLMNAVTRRWAARWLGRADDLFEHGPAVCREPEASGEDELEDDDGTLF